MGLKFTFYQRSDVSKHPQHTPHQGYYPVAQAVLLLTSEQSLSEPGVC